MTFDEFQQESHKTAVYPKEKSLEYLTLGLCGEAGELANKVKKIFRDHNSQLDSDLSHTLIMEVGDIIWYASELSLFLGYRLNEVAELNRSKLRERQTENKLRGEGDNR